MFFTSCPGNGDTFLKTNNNTFFREGKLDVLKELCKENQINYFVVKALKAQDKFGQTPMLSAINAPENR